MRRSGGRKLQKEGIDGAKALRQECTWHIGGAATACVAGAELAERTNQRGR